MIKFQEIGQNSLALQGMAKKPTKRRNRCRRTFLDGGLMSNPLKKDLIGKGAKDG